MREIRMTKNNPSAIEFFHDVLCAWCYAMSPRVQRLAMNYPEKIEIVHRAFPLALEPDGIEQIFGSKERGKEEILEHWRRANENDNQHRIKPELMATKKFDYPYSTPGLLACKAAELQGGHSMHGKMFDRVQKTHLTECHNIADFEILKMCAKDIGLDVEQWRKDYHSDKVKNMLDDDLYQAKSFGINSVPSIMVNGKHKFSGAQSYEALENWFKNLPK